MEQYTGDISEQAQVNPDGFFSELSQNACSVRVAVRVRPLIGRELAEGSHRTCVGVSDADNKLTIGEKQFQFDRVFSSDSEQREIFDVCARNLVLGCFQGYNATILAYGQTGSGKTHTMGTASTAGLSEEQIGIVPRVFDQIFEELERKRRESSLSEFTIKVSFLELYNEELKDLLDPMQSKAGKELLIKERGGTISIQGLKEEPVQSQQECIELLNKGISHRTTSATLMNEGSSRSHAIFTVAIEQKIVREIDIQAESAVEQGKAPPGQQEEMITAKFHFVDLAGSERIKRTGATGQLMKEGISINKGLLCLGNVISALTDEKQKDKHIPYRDSKLTRILQDSLGGNSRTTMIACVSPAESNYEESLNSIKYASRARNIKNKAVVNRDANSLLIDSLRQQISKLQGEIQEYQGLLRENGVAIPMDFEERKNQSATRLAANRPSIQHDQDTFSGGAMNGDMRDIKIALSRKEKELKSLADTVTQLQGKLYQRDLDLSQLQSERDILRLRNELYKEHLDKNSIVVEGDSAPEGVTLVKEYQEKLDRMSRELEKKTVELQNKSLTIGELQNQKQIDDKLLNRQLEDIKRLKGQIKKLEDNAASNLTSPLAIQSSGKKAPVDVSRFKLNLQCINNSEQQNKQVDNGVILDAENINKKLIDSLAVKLDSIFGAATAEGDGGAAGLMKSPGRRSSSQPPGGDEEELLTSGLQGEIEDPLVATGSKIEEKELILAQVKSSISEMQTQYQELLKQQYDQRINEAEAAMAAMEIERQATLRNIQNVNEKHAVEQQFKPKMEEQARKIQLYKDKEKEKEQMAKQISSRETKIKSLEDDINKMKRSKENLEKQLKNDADRFSKFKQSVSKELTQARKAMTDKERELMKVKHDLKKTDQFAQQKLSELRGLQKKSYEERMRKELEKQSEMDGKGIDIDRIKQWIQDNTDRMLKHNEIKESMEHHLKEKNRIEDEMFAQGDQLNALMLEKERKEIEKQELELAEQPDEGRILELEEEIYQSSLMIENVGEQLESLEETLKFNSDRYNQFTEEAISLDIDNIEPLKFSCLQSVDAARVTLQTFFSVMLDLNIYKRDLETKCIESDEIVLDLQAQLDTVRRQVEELQNKSEFATNISSNNLGSGESINALAAKAKEKALKNIVNNLEGFVDFQEVKNLNLTPGESTSLTKLSLSKIVSNLKQQCEDEKKKNHNLVLKLEQAIKDKEAIKLKFDNLKKKTVDDAIAKDPKQFQNQVQQANSVSNEVNSNSKQFQSLAAARANRRNKGTTSVNQIEEVPDKNTPGQNGTKYRSRLNPQKSNLEEANAHSDNVKSGRLNPQVSGKLPPKKQTSGLTGRKSRSLSRTEASDDSDLVKPIIKNQPNFMNRTKAQPGYQPNPNVKRQPPLKSRQQQHHQEDIQVLNQTPVVIEPVHVTKVVPSLKDRRNQRKQGFIDEEGQKTESDKVNEEIEKIKEETFMITNNQSHFDRRQSRAQQFSKKIEQERGLSNQRGTTNYEPSSISKFGMNHINDLTEDFENEDSPRAAKAATTNETSQIIGEHSDASSTQGHDMSYQEESNPLSQAHHLNQELRNLWSHEELAFLENQGSSNLIGCEIFDGKIILLFDDFTIRQLLMETMEEISSMNLMERNGFECSENAVDFAVDKEVQAIAIATKSIVYIFDFQFLFQSQIELENIESVVFCQYNLVVLVNMEDSACLVTYQIEDCTELGLYEMKTDGNRAILKSDNNFLYLACGIKLAKLTMPDIQPVYVIETEHEGPIIDFTLSPQTIVTTSADRSVRVQAIETGEQCMNSLDDLDCDHLEATEDFVLTRCLEGSSILVWRYYHGNVDLDCVDEIDMSELQQAMGDVQQFKMQGKIQARFHQQGAQYDIVLLITVIADGIVVNALKHKPLSEM